MARANAQGYFLNEEDAVRTLKAEGRRFKLIALKVWRRYLASYQPKQYVRTRQSQRAIQIGKVKRVGTTNEYRLEITFDDDLTYHDSYFNTDSKTHPQGHSIMLISKGWKSPKLERYLGKKVHRLTYFEGINYLGEVERLYNATAPNGITLEIQWQGKDHKLAKHPFTR